MKIFRTKQKSRVAHRENGVALLFTLIVMITMASVIGAYLGFVQHSTKSTGAQISDSLAVYLAEAGIHYGIYSLKQDITWTGTASAVNLGEGVFTVSVTDLGGGEYRLISTGTVTGQSRTVQQDLAAALTPKTDTWQETG